VLFVATKTTAILRSVSSIQRIFYDLGKSDEQAMHNFYEYVDDVINIFDRYLTFSFRLAAGERSKLKPISRPFIPTDVYPIDLLPHTTHAEILVKCVRV
jgi:hypothetical protein